RLVPLLRVPGLPELLLLREFREKTARAENVALAVARRGEDRMDEVELVAGAGQRHVETAALLLFLVRIAEGGQRGEMPLREPDHEDRLPLEPLGPVDGRKGDVFVLGLGLHGVLRGK